MLSIVYFWLLCQKSSVSKYVVLFLYLQFYSIDQQVCLCTNTMPFFSSVALQYSLWSGMVISPLLVALQTDTTTLEINLKGPQKIGNGSTWKLSYTTLRHIPKRWSTMPQGYLLHNVHSDLICDSQNLETTQKSHDRRNDTENVVHLKRMHGMYLLISGY